MTTIQQVCQRLIYQFDELPGDSVLCGKTGAAVIAAFVSEDELPQDIPRTLGGLLDIGGGDISVTSWMVWLVASLLENELISLPNAESFNRLANEFAMASRRHCYYSPVKVTSSMQFYPFGIVGLKSLQLLEEIPFYSMVEWVVLFMRDCEFFLTKSIPHLYDHTKLPASIIHSTLRFMQQAEQQRIFTWKAHQLQTTIANLPYNREDSRPADNYILNFMLGHETVSPEWSDEDLAYIGTIAYIYSRPELFAKVYRPIDIESCKIDHLVGIGLGLLSNRLNGMEL